MVSHIQVFLPKSFVQSYHFQFVVHNLITLIISGKPQRAVFSGILLILPSSGPKRVVVVIFKLRSPSDPFSHPDKNQPDFSAFYFILRYTFLSDMIASVLEI